MIWLHLISDDSLFLPSEIIYLSHSNETGQNY